MLARLKKLLNIKYFMVGYLGLLVLFSSLYFKDVIMFVDGLLIVALYSVFDLLWTYARDRVWYLPTSSWISGFVLTVGALPKPPLIILITLPLLAVASKQLLHFGKNRHIFNPAAFALAVMSFIAPSVSWWAVAAGTIPTISGLEKFSFGMWFFLFSCVGAVIILWRQNRWHVTLPFLISYAFFLGIFLLNDNVPVSRLPQALFFQIVNGAVLFFSTVMVIEPITSTFKTKRQEIIYGSLVGLVIVVITYISRQFNLVSLDPLVFGLLTGNFLAAMLFLPSKKSLLPVSNSSSIKKTTGCVNCNCGKQPVLEIPTIKDEPSYWFRAVPEKKQFPSLQGEKDFDAVIVGGGIVGISTAYFLAKNGIKVALLEASTIGSGDSSYTTACATRFLDSVDASLVAWEASEAAIALFKKIIIEEKIDCEWEDIDTICFSGEENKELVKSFIDISKKFQAKDSSIEFLSKSEASAVVGVPVMAAYRKKSSEGIFHMRKFLKALTERAIKNGVVFFEDSEAVDFILGEQVVVKTKTGSVKAKWLVVASGLPSAKFFPEVAGLLRSAVSYVIDVKFLKKPPFSKAFFWDDKDPYHYFRSVGENEFILGGEDWKTDNPKPNNNPHLELEKWLKNFVGSANQFEVINSWQGSLFYTPDTLPLVGPHKKYGDNVIFLTGWDGNGTAQGIFAANLASDIIQKKNNSYLKLFACDRRLSWSVKSEIKLSMKKNIEKKGEVLDIDGQKVAVLKKDGEVKAFSAVCPHLGCIVEWNDGEDTWDCPCHGSRFESDGALKHGPAKRGLDPVEVKIENDEVKLV